MRNRRNALAVLINFKTTQKNRIEERVKEKGQSLEDTKRALLNHLRNEEKSVSINNINDKSTLLNAVKTSTPSKQSNIQNDLVTNTTNGNITTNIENNINLTFPLNDSNNNIGLTSVASTSTVQQKLTDKKYNFKVLTSSVQNNQKLASSIKMFINRTRTCTSIWRDFEQHIQHKYYDWWSRSRKFISLCIKQQKHD